MRNIITIEKPMTIFKKAQKAEYVPAGSWDWSHLSKEEIWAEIEKASKEADEERKRGELLTLEECKKEWDEAVRRCVATR